MARAVSCWHRIEEIRVRSWASPCGVYGVQIGKGIGFTASTWESPLRIIPPLLHTRISFLSWRCTIIISTDNTIKRST